ncbi:MAG: polysaccharide lyase beta-sandwich domain-containing protein, partial [Candidatus Latescibacterota bacterium]
VANEPNLQAVRHRALGVTGIAFYTPGKLTAENGLTIEADQPCLLLVREEGRRLEISASNPENKGMRLTVRVGNGAGKTAESVIFDLPEREYAGASVTRIVIR